MHKLKIVYILDFDYRDGKYKYVHKSYPEKFKLDARRLTPLESLIKSINSVRKFTMVPILLIANELPPKLKSIPNLEFEELDFDPYGERIQGLANIPGDVLFVEHDVFFIKDIFPKFTKSWVNGGSSDAPFDFHGDLFFINSEDRNEFHKHYNKIYAMPFNPNEKCVFACNSAFNHIGAIKEYDVLRYPQWNQLEYDCFGYHTHYDI